VRLDVLTAAKLIFFVWVVTSCGLVTNVSEKRTYCLFSPENGKKVFFPKLWYLPIVWPTHGGRTPNSIIKIRNTCSVCSSEELLQNSKFQTAITRDHRW
jgi:hypothetical protein